MKGRTVADTDVLGGARRSSLVEKVVRVSLRANFAMGAGLGSSGRLQEAWDVLVTKQGAGKREPLRAHERKRRAERRVQRESVACLVGKSFNGLHSL